MTGIVACFFRPAHGAIAQLGERVVRNDEVGGSIAPGSTNFLPAAFPGRFAVDRSQSSPLDYLPVNRSGRFSTKLATPSRKSLPRNAATISRLASAVASARFWNGTS